ncbi:MAG: hypothetical protein OEO79_16975 [Gemmatimonadota bacterium]|nr:hypothetical protein [Gemmatimonadota bacterium]
MRVIDQRLLALLTSCATTACATTTAPRGFLPDVAEAQTSAYGSWIDVLYEDQAGNVRVRGELIAMTPDSMWVLGGDEGWAIATSAIRGGQLAAYDSGGRDAGVLTALGTVSTISNGAFLIFTAPMWLIVGSSAAAAQSRVPLSDLTESGWSEISSFARFPQGMPPGMLLGELEPKPVAGG